MLRLAALLLICPGAALADPACLILDPAQATAPDGVDRTLRTFAVGLADGTPGPGSASFIALFSGPSAEAPGAMAGTVYSQTFTCVAGPAEVSGPPYWMMPGGIVCTPDCGSGLVQVRPEGDGFAFWMDGLSLTQEPGGTCGQGIEFTTRGDVGVGYPMVVSDNPGHCAPVGGSS